MDTSGSLLKGRFVTYKQYKDDTESIAGWLAQNAARCGYEATVATASSIISPVSGPRLKGKARKQAREATKAAQGPPAGTSNGQKYSIRILDFPRMAKAIADFRPKVEIPKALDSLFQRALGARKKFTEWYEEHLPQQEASSQRHTHFTNILATAWETLRPFEKIRISSVKQPAVETKAAERPLVGLLNRFTGLHVEQPSKQDEETELEANQDEGGYSLKDSKPAAIVNSEEYLEDEFFFSIHTLLEELRDVRGLVRSIWSGYRDGTTELILCSLLTNTAIQLARRAEHELDLVVKRPSKYPSLLYPTWKLPGVLMYETHKGGLANMGTSLDYFLEPGPHTHRMDCSHSDLCMWSIITALKHSLWEQGELGEQFLMPQNLEYEGGRVPPEDFRRIKAMLPCLRGISHAMDESFANDEITSGVGTMFKTGTIPIWVAFAVQLLLDIQDEVNKGSRKPVREVQQHMRNKLSAVRSRKLDQEPFCETPEAVTFINATLHAYELDILRDGFRSALIGGGMRDPRTGGKVQSNLNQMRDMPGFPEYLLEPDLFLEINPVKCGMLKYGLYLQPHVFAAGLEEAWRGITAMVISMSPADPCSRTTQCGPTW